MLAKLAALALPLTLVATAASAEILVTCAVFDGEHTTTVTVDKYAPALPPEQQHFTSLTTIGTTRYVVAETFDGSGKVGIGRAKVLDDRSLEFDVWAFAKPPVDLFTETFVSCK